MAMDFSIFKFGSASSAAEPTPVLKRAADIRRDFDSVLSTERASERAAERARANRDDSNRPDAADRSRSESVLSSKRPAQPARPESAPEPRSVNDAPRNKAATVARENLKAAEAAQTGLIENPRRTEHVVDNHIESEIDAENELYEETHKLIADEYGLSGKEGTPLSSTIDVTGAAEEEAALKTDESVDGYGVEALRNALLSNSASGIDESGALLIGSNSTTIGTAIGGTTDGAIGSGTGGGADEGSSSNGIGSVVAEEVFAAEEILVNVEALTDNGKADRASILLGNAHGDAATEAQWAATHSDIGTDTRLFALSDHFETLPRSFETSETESATTVERPETAESDKASSVLGSGIGSGTEPGNSQAFSQLEAEELAFRIDLGANGVNGIGTAKLLVDSSATTGEGSEAVAATESNSEGQGATVLTETDIFMIDGDDVTATLTDVLPEELQDDLPNDSIDNLPENLIDASGGDPAASTPGLGAQFSRTAAAQGTEAKASASLLGATGAGEVGRAASGTTGNEAASSEAKAAEVDTTASEAENPEHGDNGENNGTEQNRAASSDRGSAKGLENAVQRLRENRTGADANGIKRLIEQAEAGAEVDGSGNEARAKSAEAQQNGLKGEGNGTGASFGKGGAGTFYGSSYGNGGYDGNGQPGKGNGRLATAQEYAALMGRDGELRSMSFTETVRAATTGASAAEGVENTLKVYEKFAQAIKLSFLGGGKQVNLRLSPAHLGNLQIKLTGDGGNVIAKIIVDSVAVKNLFESDAGKLKELFNQQGLNMEEFTVEVREQSIGAKDSWSADLWERHANKGASGKERDGEVVVPMDSAAIKASMNAAYGLGANRGIDLFA